MSESNTPKTTPKKGKPEEMFEEPTTPTAGKAKGSAMSDADCKFLIECLKNTQGPVTVSMIRSSVLCGKPPKRCDSILTLFLGRPRCRG
jgi:hypothetical protein